MQYLQDSVHLSIRTLAKVYYELLNKGILMKSTTTSLSF